MAEATFIYVAAMKSDLRNLATYEEQYSADNNGAYFSGDGSGRGFTPSQNVTVSATVLSTSPVTWNTTASHSQSSKTCSNATGSIICS